MPYFFVSLTFLLSLFSCREASKQFDQEELMLNREIQVRLKELEPFQDTLQAMGLEPESIHKRFQDFLLMSKDVENLQASVNLSNRYLNDLCAEHRLNSSSFHILKTNLSLSEISYFLKQNELNVLNQLVFQKLNRKVNLHTAH